MMKIGVLGGSFDPIHNGHLLLGEEIREALNLDEILFMPTFIQPFKQDSMHASSDDRLAMLELAIRDNPKFRSTTIELDRKEVSYTFQSLRLLQRQFRDEVELVFILGYDMFMNITKWWNAVGLLKEFSFAVGMRSGTDVSEVNQFADELRDKFGTTIYMIKNRIFDVSSTELKERIKNNASLKYLVPDAVSRYIFEKKLYFV